MPSVASQPLRRITTSLLLVMPSVSLHARQSPCMHIINHAFTHSTNQSFGSSPSHSCRRQQSFLLLILPSSSLHVQHQSCICSLVQPINKLFVHQSIESSRQRQQCFLLLVMLWASLHAHLHPLISICSCLRNVSSLKATYIQA